MDNKNSQNSGLTDLATRVRSGDRRALAQSITLLESTRDDHRQQAEALLASLTPQSGKSVRVGISGVPGVGKSTFVEALGNHVIESGHRVAVLSVDPSSAITGGSILGDKTRMQRLSQREQAYIRPSPAGQTLGGVTRRTREAVIVCEAAGYDVVIIETVGVGQSETAVADMTDVFVLMLLPDGGDELQGIKRGIMELADIVLINKADGEMTTVAKKAATEHQHALRLVHPRTKFWRVPVQTCSAKNAQGIAAAWQTIGQFCDQQKKSGQFHAHRASQARACLWSEMSESLLAELRQHPLIEKNIPQLEAMVANGELPATLAAKQMLSLFFADEAKKELPPES